MKSIYIPPWLPALLSLALRLTLFDGIVFVNPDGATYLDYNLLVMTQRLPFYSILVHIVALSGLPQLLAAKIVSSIFAAGAIFILTLLGREFGLEKRRAWLASLPLAVDPFFTLHTIQPLTEGVFVLFALLATLFVFRFLRTNRWTDLFGLLFVSGLATLTRPEGFVFLPLCLFGLYMFLRRDGKWRDVPPILLGIFPWLLIIIWNVMIVHNAGYLSEFAQSLQGFELADAPKRALLHLFAVSAHLIFLGIIPVIIGMAHIFGVEKSNRSVLLSPMILLYLFLSVWIGISLHWYFDWRFSTILAAWLAIPVGVGLDRWLGARRAWMRLAQATIVAICLAGPVLSNALVYGYKDVGADLRAIAEESGKLVERQVILSDELPITSYYLQRFVFPYDDKVMFANAYIILHDRYRNIDEEREKLNENYRIDEILDIETLTMAAKNRRAVLWLIQRRPRSSAISP